MLALAHCWLYPAVKCSDWKLLVEHEPKFLRQVKEPEARGYIGDVHRWQFVGGWIG